ncbi:MAG TPA: hypothetical protein VGJ93_09605 [Desulfuromonadaceae bacterium]|jgi:hypothetical protein
MNNQKMKIMFFSPNAAIWIHAFPEALVAESLAQQGHEITYIGCGGVLDKYCISMSAFGIHFGDDRSRKKRICSKCIKNEKLLRSNFAFSGPDLIDLVTESDKEYADNIVSSIRPDNFLELVIEEIPIGRITLFELLLNAKKSSLDFTSVEWEIYQAALYNSIIVLRGMQKLFKMSIPDRVIAYNTLYSVNNVACSYAKLFDIPYYMLHAGNILSNRLSTLMLTKENGFHLLRQMVQKWNDVKYRPCTASVLKHVTDHYLEVTRGRSVWAYSSSPKGSSVNLRHFFGINDEQKVICATMSSYDERFAAGTVEAFPLNIPDITFTTQIEWIKALVSYASKRTDLNLIIRVHPREFPNKRESVLSEHARLLKTEFSRLPANVRVNWPTDNISLYDLAVVTDVFVNAWSSTGKEMALLGIPVVLFSDKLVFYPADLNYVGNTETEYFQKIEQALEDGWSPEWIRKVYRWSAMEYAYSLLNISESFSYNEYQKELPFFTRGLNFLLKFISPDRMQKLDCRNRAIQLSDSRKIKAIIESLLNSALDMDLEDYFATETEEISYLKKEVQRLVDGIYPETANGTCLNPLAKRLRDFAKS